MDEPFTGTKKNAAEQELRNLCNFITDFPNTLCLLTTHFDNVTSDKKFKTHHMECLEPEPNMFQRTYQLLPYNHPWWNKDKQTRNRYIKWMIEKARSAVTDNVLSSDDKREVVAN